MGGVTHEASGLRADCSACFGLCCVALPFTRSADFAISKPAGQACRNLGDDFGCRIHAGLRERGFAGCTAYDCFGAGQKVSQVVFAGVDWRADGGRAESMFAVFPVVRHLQELLRYLDEVLGLDAAAPVHARARDAFAEIDRLTRGTPEEIGAVDVAARRDAVNAVLLRASELVRTGPGRRPRDHRGADLIGARLHGADLRAASLRGAYLIAADLTGADLRRADLIGADLRDADLAGADLTGALFVTQPQINGARGDAATRLPVTVERPAHWPAHP